MTFSEAGSDQTICEDIAIMAASNPGIGNGQWSIVGGSGSANFTDPHFGSTEVTDLDKGDNLLRWTVINKGCVSNEDVFITSNMPSNAYAGAKYMIHGNTRKRKEESITVALNFMTQKNLKYLDLGFYYDKACYSNRWRP